ncbi:RNA polymerase sigma factor [Hyphococcus luteus]|uniref:RNA polymerase subunit sigma-24 n=1 Tax=Hyphococcus luteus TaxID=2058213 RepID=A0A2S7K1K5_9PROT|nr:RNA polymerase sigma factor [Marinicaulis flavus]PQA86376.1 RNA polymerase subunit sigma-24 [Marinicaulis flavus]
MSQVFKAFLKHKPVIRRIVGKYRSNPSDIEELVQETFLRAYAAELKAEIRQPEKFLYRIAKNLSISRAIRKENSTTQFVGELSEMEVFADDGQVSQEDHLDARQRLAVFAEALESLSPELRETLIMRRIEGLTVPKIAMRLDLSVSAIEKRLAKAIVDCYAYIRGKGLDPADFGAKKIIRMKVASRRVATKSDKK